MRNGLLNPADVGAGYAVLDQRAVSLRGLTGLRGFDRVDDDVLGADNLTRTQYALIDETCAVFCLVLTMPSGKLGVPYGNFGSDSPFSQPRFVKPRDGQERGIPDNPTGKFSQYAIK